MTSLIVLSPSCSLLQVRRLARLVGTAISRSAVWRLLQEARDRVLATWRDLDEAEAASHSLVANQAGRGERDKRAAGLRLGELQLLRTRVDACRPLRRVRSDIVQDAGPRVPVCGALAGLTALVGDAHIRQAVHNANGGAHELELAVAAEAAQLLQSCVHVEALEGLNGRPRDREVPRTCSVALVEVLEEALACRG